MKLNATFGLTGHVRVFEHPPRTRTRRDTYQQARVVHDDHNAIERLGLVYIAQMLLADPLNGGLKYGITQLGVHSGANEVFRADLTDQFTVGGSVTNILYISTLQPALQPVTINGARLYLGQAGAFTTLATANVAAFQKTNLLACTVEWVINLTAG